MTVRVCRLISSYVIERDVHTVRTVRCAGSQAPSLLIQGRSSLVYSMFTYRVCSLQHAWQLLCTFTRIVFSRKLMLLL